ncbi:MAG: class I SAM-dependent methyltransferase [Sedimentitalea sp.]|uniref:class I SAM-dependent methyltransferase n=1 Tax=Sedimentitalea sp. TaxID=2048915 RepID=UPI0032657F71
MNTHSQITPDFDAIKIKQNAAWSSGNYAVVGTTLQIVGETLAEAMDLKTGSKVLDVAAGNGNATLAFARRWHEVTSTDYVPSLLAMGEDRAVAEGHRVTFKEADAEALPFADGTFDATVSTFGVMFTPNQTQAANELIRVTRNGGQVGMANWTPSSFIGRLFKTLGAHVVPPAGVKSPALWGDETWINETFETTASLITSNVRQFNFRYRSPSHFVEVFRTLYGPVHKAFLALDEAGQMKLEADILALIDEFNIAEDGTMNAPADYAEVIIYK